MQQFESFAQMQRDAAMRVMEMQRRAQAAMRDSSSPPPELPAFMDSPSESPLSEPETEQIMPASEEREFKKPEISQEDTERALVTAILLLLMRENADERLIFALLYILM